MDIRDYVYTNYKGNIIVDSDGFAEDLTNNLLCFNIFEKTHIEIIEKILGYEK